jgi:hypothetical protein
MEPALRRDVLRSVSSTCEKGPVEGAHGHGSDVLAGRRALPAIRAG